MLIFDGCKHKCFREAGSKIHKTDLEKVVICVCVQAHTGVRGEGFYFFLRLLCSYGSWEPKRGAKCGGMLKKTVGVLWRASVLKILHCSSDVSSGK